MPDFFDLLAQEYDSTRTSDRELVLGVTLKISFRSTTVRLWSGFGRLTTPNGDQWIGTHNGDDENPGSYVQIPAIPSVREGNAPILTFVLGYLSKDQYEAIRADQDEAKGALIEVGKVLLPRGELNASCNPGAISRIRAKSVSFKENASKNEDGSLTVSYVASLQAQNFNAGRATVDVGTHSEAGQKFRAKLFYDVDGDIYNNLIPQFARGITLSA